MDLGANFRKLSVCALLLSAILLCWSPASPAQATQASNWRENYAYTLGVQAYVYSFPWLYLPTLRWQWVASGRSNTAPVNHFYHQRTLVDASYRDGGNPNNDTLDSVAWLDVGLEPIILSVPDVGDRYYTMEMASMDSDNFAYVGKRATGTKAGNYAIVGPHWRGTLPAGVKALPPSRTPWVLIMGRTLVNGPDDIAAVGAIQDQYKLTPLSSWGKPDATLPSSPDVWRPFDAKTDPLADWKTINRAMTENPPEARHAALLKFFASVGIGPEQNIDTQNDVTKRALARALTDGHALLKAAFVGGWDSKNVNGWSYHPPAAGRAGLADEFLTRSAIQCFGGIVDNDPEEAVDLIATFDRDGNRLNGINHYVIHFAPGEEPKVGAFWSITMYGTDHNLVANPINRYSLGDRSRNLKRDVDGGLTIYLQADSPGADKESNWLPAPRDEFNLTLRTYMPGPEIVEQSWEPPPIKKAG